MPVAPSGGPSSCATSCEMPTLATTNARGARSRTTAYVRRRPGSRSAARWLPTPIPRPWRAAASASVAFTCSAPAWPPVIPAITSGSARACPSSLAPRSIRAASVAGRASWTRWTSSQPGARRVSMSSSAAIRRCSALRRSIAVPAKCSPAGLLEDAIALECAPFVEREAEDLAEDVVVVGADRRTGPLLLARGRREPERRRHHVHRADGRVRDGRPHRAMRELRVGEQLRDREDRGDPQTGTTQERDDLVALARAGPGLDPPIEVRACGPSAGDRRRPLDAGRA